MDLIWKIYGIETPQTEYKFHPTRRWRFDYVWIAQGIAVEIEGGVWNRGRHNRGKGFLGDMEKYNEGTKLGWRIFRFTPDQIRNGSAQTFMKPVFAGGR